MEREPVLLRRCHCLNDDLRRPRGKLAGSRAAVRKDWVLMRRQEDRAPLEAPARSHRHPIRHYGPHSPSAAAPAGEGVSLKGKGAGQDHEKSQRQLILTPASFSACVPLRAGS